jgi:hypothetical protein
MNAFAQMAEFCAQRGAGLEDETTDELVFEVVIRKEYRPTGTTGKLIRILRDNPGRTFSSTDLAEIIGNGFLPKQVVRCLDIARNYGLVDMQHNGVTSAGTWRWRA